MKRALADYIQVWGFEKDSVVYLDGSMGFGIECSPLDISCWEDDSINQLSEQMDQFLNGLPTGLNLQFVRRIRGGNGRILDQHLDLSCGAKEKFPHKLCEQRVNRLKELDEVGVLPTHTLELYVRQAPVTPLRRPSGVFKKKEPLKIAEERLASEGERLERIYEDISRELETLGIAHSRKSAEKIAARMYEQWNPSRDISLGEFDPEDVRPYLLFTDVNPYEEGFSLSRIHHRIISLKVLSKTTASMAIGFETLPFNSELFVSIGVLDQTRFLEKLHSQRKLTFSLSGGNNSGLSDIESEAKLDDVESLIEQMVAGGQKLFSVSVNVVLRSESKEELESQVSETLMKFRELSGTEAMVESLGAWPVFSEFAIPHARASERVKHLTTSDLSHLLPIFGPWSGHKIPRLLLRSRLGTLVKLDPFADELTNFSHFIIGGSGSGKSYLTNMLILQLLKENAA